MTAPAPGRDGEQTPALPLSSSEGRSDAYGIEIAPGQNDALILACTVCIDQIGRG